MPPSVVRPAIRTQWAAPTTTCHVTAGDVLLVNYDDGAIVLKVTRVETLLQVGGPLANRKRINRPGGALSSSELTGKYRGDIVARSRSMLISARCRFLAAPWACKAHARCYAMPLGAPSY